MSDLQDAGSGSSQSTAPRGHTPDIEDFLNLEPDENDLLNPSTTGQEGCPSESLLNSDNDRGTDDTRSSDSSSSDSEGKSETEKMVARKVKIAIDKYVKSLNKEREKKKRKKELKAKKQQLPPLPLHLRPRHHPPRRLRQPHHQDCSQAQHQTRAKTLRGDKQQLARHHATPTQTENQMRRRHTAPSETSKTPGEQQKICLGATRGSRAPVPSATKAT